MIHIADIVQKIDFYILDSIQSGIRCEFLDHAFASVTELSIVTILWISVGLMMAFSKRYRKYGMVLLFALAIGTDIGVYIIKPLVCRIRPYVQTGFVPFIKPPGGYSFPSGHTLSSTVSAFCVYKASRKAGSFTIVLGALIAFTRLYFYVHFPTDILGGFVIGAVISVSLLHFLKKTDRTISDIWR